MSATYALATETFPPVSPSIALARNSAARGRVKIKVPIIVELMLNKLLMGDSISISKLKGYLSIVMEVWIHYELPHQKTSLYRHRRRAALSCRQVGLQD